MALQGKGLERQNLSKTGNEAEEMATDEAVSADHFIWHHVTRAVGSMKSQGPELIEAVG